MRHKKRNTIALLVVSLILFCVQAGVWAKANAHEPSETAKQNIIGHHQPNEMAGVAGMGLLFAAFVLASIPRREPARKTRG